MARARTNRPENCPYVTRGGLKLEFALLHFGLSVSGLVVADLGCHRGGFTDCLLQRGAARVHAVDTAYGVLDWRLRNDRRVVVHERTNLLYWSCPEPCDLVVIDAGWTPQHLSVPAALRSLKPQGRILSLIKPQYEAERHLLRRGVLPYEFQGTVLEHVRQTLLEMVEIVAEAQSPILGSGGNSEFWFHMRPRAGAAVAGEGQSS